MASHYIDDFRTRWNGVGDSAAWQDGVFNILCAAYSVVGAVALIQLIRIGLRVPEYGWTTQKVFHLMNFIVCMARAFVFGFHNNISTLKPTIFRSILFDLPGLIFFSTYTLLVLFWAEIYNQARSIPSEGLRPLFLSINGGIYGIQVCIWLYEGLSASSAGAVIARLFLAAISLTAAVGFSEYGRKLYGLLKMFPVESKGRQRKLKEVGLITVICFTCFLIRTLVVAFSAFVESADVDALDHPILDLFYYTLVEVVPSALVLFILRKLPPKRLSG